MSRISFILLLLLAFSFAYCQISFKPYVAYPAGKYPQLCKVADIDNDSLNEVVLLTDFYFDSTTDYKIFLFKYIGGQMVRQKMIDYPHLYPGAQSFDVKDLNGDLLPDIVLGAGDSIFIFINNGGTDFELKQRYGSGISVNGIRIGDFNNDKKNDIAVSHGNDSYIKVFENRDSVFSPRSYPVVQSGYDQLKSGDINHDSLTDLVFLRGQGLGSSRIVFFLQNAGGNLVLDTSWQAPPSPFSNLVYGIAVGDLDQDGKNDMVATDYYNGRIVLWTQGESGLKYLGQCQTASAPEPVRIADFDLDGKNDIVAANGGWNCISVFRQKSAGSFNSMVKFSIPFASHYKPDGMDVGDVNGDGLPDIVLADYLHGLIVLYNNSITTAVKALPVSRERSAIRYFNRMAYFYSSASGPARVSVFDCNGRMAYKIPVTLVPGMNAVCVPELSRGIYLAEVSSNGVSLRSKIVMK